MVVTDCPACGAKVRLHTKPKMGQRTSCSACKAELEVVWLEPVELDWPYDADQDDFDELDEEFDEDDDA
jgi:alpha-aminoadipate/glutamate carrier protein LysW